MPSLAPATTQEVSGPWWAPRNLKSPKGAALQIARLYEFGFKATPAFEQPLTAL